MGRRVLTVTEMTFHEKYVHHAARCAPSDLDGEDLLELFHEWALDIPEQDRTDDGRQTWVDVGDVRRVGERIDLLDLRVGAYGERGELLNVETGEVVHEIEDNEAPVGENRALLYVPRAGERAYFLAEESSRGSAGGHVLAMFRHHFSEHTDAVTMETSRVSEAEVWAELAGLTEVEVRVTGRSVDIADGPDIQVGRISYLARPERGVKFFPRSLLHSLRDETVLRRILSVPDLDPDHEVYVRMERDGRSKKFMLGENAGPAIREVITDAGERPLSDDELVELCTDRVTDLFARHEELWEPAWSRPRGR